ncbi:MAG: response regulator [Rhodospirillales bacterium]|nr:response regulator [Alphaproteobacteria bacterium]MCB1838752.1 response regulator [Alphaproteobacteria bacterium]MCB9977035.1 response regulator [Rhodospirillales bacterium]
MTNQPLTILLAEDEENDAFFLKQALEAVSAPNTVHHVRDGQQALDFLKQQGAYESAPRPDIILLDINMPKKSGYDVLLEIKADDSLKAIPVIVISGSNDVDDVYKSYNHYAAAYITKSKSLESMNNLVSAVDSFWFRHVTLPRI